MSRGKKSKKIFHKNKEYSVNLITKSALTSYGGLFS